MPGPSLVACRPSRRTTHVGAFGNPLRPGSAEPLTTPRASMSRFLFVVPPLSGHIKPTVALSAELVSRGHQVAWAGHAALLAPLLPPEAKIYSTDRILSAEALNAIAERARGLRGAEAFRFLWKDFIIP